MTNHLYELSLLLKVSMCAKPAVQDFYGQMSILYIQELVKQVQQYWLILQNPANLCLIFNWSSLNLESDVTYTLIGLPELKEEASKVMETWRTASVHDGEPSLKD